MSRDTHAWLDALVNRQMPGGCDDCNAEQMMTRPATGVYVIHGCHDDTCPTLARVAPWPDESFLGKEGR